MATPIEIANVALIGLGNDVISSFSEESKAAVALKAIWDITRKTLLRAHPWNFAIKRVELAQSAVAPAFAYNFAYKLPTDNLRVLQVKCENVVSGDYKVENGYVLTNATSCQLKYIADIVDTSIWATDFVELMIARLRAELAYPLTIDKELVVPLNRLYENIEEKSKNSDALEDIEDPFYDEISSLILVRYC